MNASDLKPGDVVWVEMGNTVGHEQAHTRPWLILSSHTRLHLVRGLDLVIGVPLTTKQHQGAAFANARILIRATDIKSADPAFGVADTLALSEHVRSFSTERITRRAGRVIPRVVDDLRAALAYLLEL
ncbi:MAG TPA: type II toxin-antitoxin system PemK/MazF family toxin [Kofleriaceae bacterium]|nr:type II toxin-antitoxin system PemK/MazF family toxin [Kofleriaceae bacterium]